MEQKRKALITGGSRGIGLATALALAGQGIDTGIFYNTSASEARDAVHRMESIGISAKAYKCNLSNLDEIDYSFNQFIEDFGDVDILINNAGFTRITPFLEIEKEDWEELLNTNLRSAFYLSQKCVRIMLRKKFGRIINVGSLGGERLIPGVSAHYAASKAGLSGLTRVMAKELARYNILVNCVAPGLIETDLTDYMSTRNREMFERFHPLKRMGTPEEVADLIDFLVSDKCGYITGETIIVGGGLA